MPDLSTFVSDLAAAFEELRSAAVTQFVASRTGPAETPEPPAAAAPTLEAEPKTAADESPAALAKAG